MSTPREWYGSNQNSGEPVLFRECRVCHEGKPVSAFHNRKLYRKDGIAIVKRYECKKCTLAKNTRWADLNRERKMVKERATRLRKTYGLTSEQFDGMLSSQGGVCAICRRPPAGGRTSSRFLCVDHDAETGAVRGLLCGTCNQGIGLLKHESASLFRAALYLSRGINTVS